VVEDGIEEKECEIGIGRRRTGGDGEMGGEIVQSGVKCTSEYEKMCRNDLLY
jgi:hypothetical protein